MSDETKNKLAKAYEAGQQSKPNPKKIYLRGNVRTQLEARRQKRNKPMTSIPPEYEGREQSLVKHLLLDHYLSALVMIIGQSKYSKIAFVDCFAGPWLNNTEDLSDTSVGHALNHLEAARAMLGRTFKRSVKIRALFIEENQTAFSRLENYLEGRPYPQIAAQAWHSRFEESQQAIVDWLDDDEFAFFFIDPTGWSHIDRHTMAPILQRPHSEYLINFMFNHINRFVEHDSVRTLLGDAVDTIPNDASREGCILEAYCEQLREEAHLPTEQARTYSFRVLFPEQDRTYFHLVYLTRHPKGICKFALSSDKLGIEQANIRREVLERERHQPSLFDAPTQFRRQRNLRDNIINRLSHENTLIDETWMADLLQDTGARLADIQSTFQELFDEGVAINPSIKRRRPTNPVQFEKGENVRLL